MQPALGLRASPPTARALVLTRPRRARSRSAADARIPRIMQRIVRHVVFRDVAPDIRFVQPTLASGAPRSSSVRSRAMSTVTRRLPKGNTGKKNQHRRKQGAAAGRGGADQQAGGESDGGRGEVRHVKSTRARGHKKSPEGVRPRAFRVVRRALFGLRSGVQRGTTVGAGASLGPHATTATTGADVKQCGHRGAQHRHHCSAGARSRVKPESPMPDDLLPAATPASHPVRRIGGGCRNTGCLDCGSGFSSREPAGADGRGTFDGSPPVRLFEKRNYVDCPTT